VIELIAIAGGLAFMVVATWLLTRALWNGTRRGHSFKAWVRRMLDAFWGMG
jgi:hypothetical protein